MKGIILIHGFGGSPYEMKPVGELAEKLGWRPYYARLPGHGGDPFEMEDITAEDWIDYLENLYTEVEKECKTIAVCGLSMGALLSGIISGRRNPDKLILLAPSVYPRQASFVLAPVARFIKGKLVRIAEKSLNPESQLFLPVKSVYQLWRVIRIFVREIDNIKARTLIIQGLEDEMVKPASGVFIRNRLKTHRKLVLVPGLTHLIPLDPLWNEASKPIKEFLNWQG